MGMVIPTSNYKPTQDSVAVLSKLDKVTVPVMVYVVMIVGSLSQGLVLQITQQQAQHSLSSQHLWMGKDGAFDYQEFADFLVNIFKVDDEWTSKTIWQWNLWVIHANINMSNFIDRELFRNENGLKPMSTKMDSDGFLEMAKNHVVPKR